MHARWRNAEDRLEVANREGERLGEVAMLTTKIFFTSWLARLDAASDLYRSLAEKLVNLVNKETER